MSDTSAPELSDELASADYPYQLLLRRFQLAHSEHGQAMLALELLTEEELAGRQEEDAADIIEVDTFLSFNDPQTSSPYSVVAVVGGPMLPSGPHEPTTRRAKEAWEAFAPLAKLAGAFVPKRIREAMPIEPHDAAGTWYTLLHWQNEPSERSLDVRPGFRRLLSDSAFLDSISAIEKHGLAVSDLATTSKSFKSSIGNNGEATGDFDESDGPAVKKTKPKAGTVEVIRLIEAGKSVDEIGAATGKSAGNVRKIKSTFRSGGYEI